MSANGTGAAEEVLPPEIEARLRRGLELLAEQTPAPGAAGRRWAARLPALALSAAAVAAVVLAGPALLGDHGGTATDVPSAGAPAIPVAPAPQAREQERAAGQAQAKSAAAQVPAGDAAGNGAATLAPESADTFAGTAPVPGPAGPAPDSTSQLTAAYDLPTLVASSARIVVGTVGEVRHGTASAASGGLDYTMATVAVDRTLRGPEDAQVVAFDYAYGNDPQVADAPQGAAFTTGQRVLLFLADTSGTVHDGIAPKHWQVVGGPQGEYAMTGAEPSAPFTMADVRAEILRQDAGR